MGLQLNRPFETLAAWAGAAIGTSLDVFNIGADILLGGVFAGGRRVARYSKLAEITARAASRARRTRMIRSLDNIEVPERLAKEGARLARIGNLAVKSSAVRSVTRAATANTLVELAIHNNEARKGNHYDIGPAIGLGIFAPIFLKAAAYGIKGARTRLPDAPNIKAKPKPLGRSLATGDTDPLPKPKVTAEEVNRVKEKAKKGEPLNEADVDTIVNHSEALDDLNKPSKNPEILKPQNKDMAEVIKRTDPEDMRRWVSEQEGENAKAAGKEFEALIEGEEIFDGKLFPILQQIAADMVTSGHKIDVVSMFPWLRNKTALRNRLKEVRQQRHGKGFRNKQVDNQDLVNMFKTIEGEFDAYVNNNKMKQKVPEKPIVSEKVEKLEKQLNNKIETLAGRTDEVGQLATLSKEIADSFKTLRGCLLAGGTDVIK